MQKLPDFKFYVMKCHQHGRPQNNQFGRNREYYGTVVFSLTRRKYNDSNKKKSIENSNNDDESESESENTNDCGQNSDNESNNDNSNTKSNNNNNEKSKSNSSSEMKEESIGELISSNMNGVEFVTDSFTFYSSAEILSIDDRAFYANNFQLPMKLVEQHHKKLCKLDLNPWPKGFKVIKRSRVGKESEYNKNHTIFKTSKLGKFDVDKCNCSEESPCSKDNNCTNYSLQIECNNTICNAPNNCQNRQFKNFSNVKIKEVVSIKKTRDRGFGAFAEKDFSQGELVLEYVGEILTKQEKDLRLKKMNDNNAPNFYLKGYSI